MPASATKFTTSNAQRYKQAMAKHFAHKIAVEETDDAASFGFDIGEGMIETTEDGLRLQAVATNEEDLQTIEEVLESHLKRFAFREEVPAFDWQRTENDAAA